MRGREFLPVAGYLESLETEGSLRTQISRFYYAAYLESRAFCEQNPGYNRTRSSAEHAEIARLLRNVDPELTASLAFMRRLRNVADYDMDVSFETVALQVLDVRLRAASVIVRLHELDIPGTDT